MIVHAGEKLAISREELRALVARTLDAAGPLQRVLILPPTTPASTHKPALSLPSLMSY